MESYLTTSVQESTTTKFRVPAFPSPSGHARIAEPTPARTAQLIADQITWPTAGLMPVPTTVAAQQHQGGRLAGFGGCNVTDTKFSTRVGPPSCSPPV